MEAPESSQREVPYAVKRRAVAVVSRTAITRLKPERVQEELVRRKRERQGVKARLDGRTGWKLAPGGRALRKARGFTDPRDAAAYAAFAVQLAAGRRQPLRLALSSGQVVVTLESRSGHGITRTMLDLAAELG
jgi:pterin-4a-carbinolamine dehydratase